MNIMLTDISSLSLDQPELPLATGADADSFAGFFSQQFPVEPVKEAQDIDINGFSAEFSTPVDGAELISGLSPASNGDESPLPLATAIPIDPNPPVKVATQLLDRAEMQTLKPGSELMTGAPTNGTTGAVLPAGGKSLPVDAAPVTGQRSMFETVTAPVASVADAIKAATSESRPQAALQAAATQPGKSGTLSMAINAAPEKIAPAADFVPAMNKSAPPDESAPPVSTRKAVGPEPGQLVTKDLLADVRPASETRQPGVDEVMRNIDFKTAAPFSRSEGSSGPTPAVAALTMGGEDQLDDTQRILKGLRQSATAETVPVRETDMGRNLKATEKIAPAGAAAVRDMPVSAEHRSPEILAQQLVNQQQPAVARHASTLDSVLVQPHALTPGNPSSSLPPHLETLTLPRNADTAAWGNGLSERVNWMIDQKQNTATIRLDPPFLGKLDVHIKIADDVTTVNFLTQHAHARDLIESASVRLRDFLQESGYQNVNVDVSQHQDRQQAHSHATFNAEAEQQDESRQAQAFEQRRRDQASYFIGEGIVDTFA